MLGIGEKYDGMVRKMAVKSVNKKLIDNGIDISSVSKEDYEVLVDERCKEIGKSHLKFGLKAALVVLGADLLIGL